MLADLLTEFTPIYLAVAFYAWWGVRGLHSPERD